MVCFMLGKENLSLWWHYQIMICILTVKMNNNNNVAEISGTLYLVWGCCDGFIILLLNIVKVGNFVCC